MHTLPYEFSEGASEACGGDYACSTYLPNPLLQDVAGVQKGRHCIRFKQKKGYALEQISTSSRSCSSIELRHRAEIQCNYWEM